MAHTILQWGSAKWGFCTNPKLYMMGHRFIRMQQQVLKKKVARPLKKCFFTDSKHHAAKMIKSTTTENPWLNACLCIQREYWSRMIHIRPLFNLRQPTVDGECGTMQKVERFHFLWYRPGWVGWLEATGGSAFSVVRMVEGDGEQQNKTPVIIMDCSLV